MGGEEHAAQWSAKLSYNSKYFRHLKKYSDLNPVRSTDQVTIKKLYVSDNTVLEICPHGDFSVTTEIPSGSPS